MITVENDFLNIFINNLNLPKIKADLKKSALIIGETVSYDLKDNKFKLEINDNTISPVLITENGNYEKILSDHILNVNNYYSYLMVKNYYTSPDYEYEVSKELIKEDLISAKKGLSAFINKDFILNGEFLNDDFNLEIILAKNDIFDIMESVFDFVVDTLIDFGDIAKMYKYISSYKDIDCYIIVDLLHPRIEELLNVDWNEVKEESLLFYAYTEYLISSDKHNSKFINSINNSDYILKFENENQTVYGMLLNTKILDKLKIKADNSNVRNKHISNEIVGYLESKKRL